MPADGRHAPARCGGRRILTVVGGHGRGGARTGSLRCRRRTGGRRDHRRGARRCGAPTPPANWSASPPAASPTAGGPSPHASHPRDARIDARGARRRGDRRGDGRTSAAVACPPHGTGDGGARAGRRTQRRARRRGRTRRRRPMTAPAGTVRRLAAPRPTAASPRSGPPSPWPSWSPCWRDARAGAAAAGATVPRPPPTWPRSPRPPRRCGGDGGVRPSGPGRDRHRRAARSVPASRRCGRRRGRGGGAVALLGGVTARSRARAGPAGPPLMPPSRRSATLVSFPQRVPEPGAPEADVGSNFCLSSRRAVGDSGRAGGCGETRRLRQRRSPAVTSERRERAFTVAIEADRRPWLAWWAVTGPT